MYVSFWADNGGQGEWDRKVSPPPEGGNVSSSAQWPLPGGCGTNSLRASPGLIQDLRTEGGTQENPGHSSLSHGQLLMDTWGCCRPKTKVISGQHPPFPIHQPPLFASCGPACLILLVIPTHKRAGFHVRELQTAPCQVSDSWAGVLGGFCHEHIFPTSPPAPTQPYKTRTRSVDAP